MRQYFCLQFYYYFYYYLPVGHLIPSTSACALRPNKIRAPDPNPTQSDRTRADPCRSEPAPTRTRCGPTPARLRSGMARNKIEKMPKLVILPSACLPRAFRVPSGTAPFECAQFPPGSAATRLGSVPFRLGSDSFWRGSALLGTGSARLRFVNELFCFSPTFF